MRNVGSPVRRFLVSAARREPGAGHRDALRRQRAIQAQAENRRTDDGIADWQLPGACSHRRYS